MGSSGGGSGGGSAAVDYPSYLKTMHEVFINHVFADMWTARWAGSPFATLTAFNPNTNIANMIAGAADFNTAILSLSFCDDWKDMVTCAVNEIDTNVFDDTAVDANIDAFGDLIDDQITAEVLPRFEAGMVDINSVISSAFVIGRALIEDGRDKAVIKYGTDLKLQNYSQRNDMIMTSVEVMRSLHIQKIEFWRVYVALVVEINRIAIVANAEYENQEADFADRDSRWDLETFQYGSNVIASIAGGTTPTQPTSAKGVSMLGGALSGAAVGTLVAGVATGGYALAYGAIAGGLLGAGSSML